MKVLRLNGRWLRIFTALLLLFSGCVSSQQQKKELQSSKKLNNSNMSMQSQPTVSQQTGSAPQQPDAVGSLWNDLWTLPHVILEESEEIVTDWDKAQWLLMAGGASIALSAGGGDERIAHNFDRHQNLSTEIDKLTDWAGNPGYHFAAAGLWYLMSDGPDKVQARQDSWTMLKAISVTGAATITLKALRNDGTPNDKNLAWPSGHTSSSFTVASVLDELYGPEIGIPAYIGAGFVGYRMMESGDHWASDVLFGAVLGYIVGHHIASGDKTLELAGFEVFPYTNYDGENTYVGIELSKQF